MAKRVLVCGAGSIGRRHIGNLLKLGAEVSVWRSRSAMINEITCEFPVQACTDLSNGIAAADAVVVATATDEHIPIAIAVLTEGRALFVEKPLSNDWVGIDELRNLTKGKIIEAGFQFRAHPNLIALANQLSQTGNRTLLTYRLAMGHRLDAWRPKQIYNESYSADAERGGGALFDLIHQIDIALWLFGPVKGVHAVMAKLGPLNIKGDDITNLLLTHENGATGHIQLDMASPIYRCEVEVMTNEEVFRWSNAEGKLRQITQKEEIILNCVPEGFKRNDLFYNHMMHWLERIENPKVLPLSSFEDAVEALKVAISARKANNLQQMIKF